MRSRLVSFGRASCRSLWPGGVAPRRRPALSPAEAAADFLSGVLGGRAPEGKNTLSRVVSFSSRPLNAHVPDLPSASSASSSSAVGGAQFAPLDQLAAGASLTSSFVRPDFTERGN